MRAMLNCDKYYARFSEAYRACTDHTGANRENRESLWIGIVAIQLWQSYYAGQRLNSDFIPREAGADGVASPSPGSDDGIPSLD